MSDHTEAAPDPSTPERAAIGKRLQEAREDANLTQAQAAERVAVHRNMFTRWESGKDLPGIENLKALCTAYGVSADWILGLSKSPQIRAGVAIINRGAERALMDAKTAEDAAKAAEQHDAWNETGPSIGYSLPREFEVVPEDEYAERKRVVQRRLDGLPRKKGGKRGGSGAKGE